MQTAAKPSNSGSPREPRLPLRFPVRHSRFNRERAGLLDGSPLAVKAHRADIGRHESAAAKGHIAEASRRIDKDIRR